MHILKTNRAFLKKSNKIIQNEFKDDGLVYSTKRMSLPVTVDDLPVTEEARCRLQLEQEFLNFDYYQTEENVKSASFYDRFNKWFN